MTPEELERECERLRAENDLLRATLAAATAALRAAYRRDDDLSTGVRKMTAAMEAMEAAVPVIEAAFGQIDAILEASPRPFEAARAEKSRRSLSRAERAAALDARGLSAPRIGMRMAIEDARVDTEGQVRPYSERQVRRWRQAKKG
jgi:hypothetical protein